MRTLRMILIAIALLTLVLGLTMGGSAHADGCFSNNGSSQPDYDNWYERKTHVDFDMTLPSVKRAVPQLKACGPDGWT